MAQTQQKVFLMFIVSFIMMDVSNDMGNMPIFNELLPLLFHEPQVCLWDCGKNNNI